MLTSGLPTPILQPGGLAHTEKPNVCSGQCAPLCLLPLSLTASRQGPETGDRLKTGECVSTINRRNSGHLNRLKYSKQFKLQGNQIFFLSSLWRIALQNSRSKVKLGHLKQPTLPTQANRGKWVTVTSESLEEIPGNSLLYDLATPLLGYFSDTEDVCHIIVSGSPEQPHGRWAGVQQRIRTLLDTHQQAGTSRNKYTYSGRS